MLSTDDFLKRANQLFETCRDRWRKQLQKSAGKNVKIELGPDDVLPFTRTRFQQWLWNRLALQARPCPYCRAPIDIISMQLDHMTPLRRGGGPELSNLQCICERCNKAKGEFTHEEWICLVGFMEGPGAHFRQRLEGTLINGGVGNMMRNFPGKKKAAKGKPVQGSLLSAF